MHSHRFLRRFVFFIALSLINLSAQDRLTAGKPPEGSLQPFLGKPAFSKQVVFDGDNRVREPYLAIGVDGTLLAVRSYTGKLRRSKDAGKTWGRYRISTSGFWTAT